jgi:hypothetical protein
MSSAWEDGQLGMFFSDQPCHSSIMRINMLQQRKAGRVPESRKNSSIGCIIKQMFSWFCSLRIFKVNKFVLLEDGFLSDSKL